MTATPTITVLDGGTGTTAVVTIDGEALATHQLYYRLAAATDWTVGLTRVGDGAITQTGLTNNSEYYFAVISTLLTVASLPSAQAYCRVTTGGFVTGGASRTFEILGISNVNFRDRTQEILAVERGT